MSKRSDIHYGTVDAPEDGKVFGMLFGPLFLGFCEIPTKVFSKRDQALLTDNTSVEAYQIGKRMKIKVVK